MSPYRPTSLDSDILSLAATISRWVDRDKDNVWSFLFEISALIGDPDEAEHEYRPEVRVMRERIWDVAREKRVADADVFKLIAREIVRMEHHEQLASTAMAEGEEMIR